MVLLDILPVRIQNLFQEEGTTIKIDKGHPIFYEGENAEDIFFIHSGIIQIAKGTESGKELTIRICGKGTIIGECHLFCSSNIYTTTAKAIEPSMLYILSKKH